MSQSCLLYKGPSDIVHKHEKSMRTDELRLSDDEHELLESYRNTEYHPTVPFGYVVAELVRGADHE